MSGTALRDLASPSTGERFAREFTSRGTTTEVHYNFTITEEFKPGENRPRIPMISWVMKRRLVDSNSLYYWSERRSPREQEHVDAAHKWKEFRVLFEAHEAKLRPIQAWIQVPPEVLQDPESLADYIDYRLVPRLGTVENEQITIGADGILRHPNLTQIPYSGSFADGLMAVCNEVEQNGATAHVIIVNSEDYYKSLVGGGTLLKDLHINGNIIIRTRMIASGCALVGDFAVATRFYHKGKSVIRFAEPPKGMFAVDGIALCAETCVGVSLNLPTHLYHMHPAQARV
jgi:hypothetical protein